MFRKPDSRALKSRLKRAVFLFLAGMLCAFLGFRLLLAWDIHRRVAAIRAAGYPTTYEALETWYPAVPDADNAALLCLRAQEVFQEPECDCDTGCRLPFFGDEQSALGEAPPADVVAEMAAVVARNAEGYALLHQAALLKKGRYPLDFSQGVCVSTEHLPVLRNEIRLLGLRAVYAVETEHREQAVEAILDALAVAETLREEPVLISQMARQVSQGLAQSILARVLSRISLEEDELRRIASAIAELDWQAAALRSYAGEQCQILEGYRMSWRYAPPDATSTLDQLVPESLFAVEAGQRALGLPAVDLHYNLELFDTCLRGVSEGWPGAMRAQGEVRSRLEEIPLAVAPLAHILMPAMSQVIDIFIRGESQRQSALVALAVERYRLRQGALPADLKELVPDYLDAVPADPFGAAPMRYRLLERGYAVYSVGPDGQDDGGQETEVEGWKDVVFRVAR